MRLSFDSEGRRSGEWGRGYGWSSWYARRPNGERLREGEWSFSPLVDGGWRRRGLKTALEAKSSMIVVSSGLRVATDGELMIGENWGYLGGI